MAKIAEVLARKYPNQTWSILDDDYNTLTWLAGNPLPKPTLDEINALRATVDAEIDTETTARKRRDKIVEEDPARLLTILDAIVAALIDTRSKIRASAITGSFDATVTSNLTAAQTLINTAKTS